MEIPELGESPKLGKMVCSSVPFLDSKSKRRKMKKDALTTPRVPARSMKKHHPHPSIWFRPSNRFQLAFLIIFDHSSFHPPRRDVPRSTRAARSTSFASWLHYSWTLASRGCRAPVRCCLAMVASTRARRWSARIQCTLCLDKGFVHVCPIQ